MKSSLLEKEKVKTMDIAGLHIEPGEKKRGWLPVSKWGAQVVEMPFTIVNGTQEGPRLAVMAGIHGCEYTGIEASIRLARDLKPQELRGTLILVHVVNIPAFQFRTPYVCPLDGLNLNRIRDEIPGGKAAGSISHRMVHTLFHSVIYPSDACIDLHAGDLYECLTEPFIIYPVTPDQVVNESIREMAEAYGVSYIWGVKENGILRTGDDSGRGIVPSIMVECGQEGKIEEKYVRVHYRGVLNIMRLLGMMAPSWSGPEKRPLSIRKGGKIMAETGGIFHSRVKPGEQVVKDDLLGEVKDIWGDVLQKVTAPTDCMILMTVSNPIIGAGDVVLGYAEF